MDWDLDTILIKMGNIDICFGINPFNSKKEIQAIVNFKSF